MIQDRLKELGRLMDENSASPQVVQLAAEIKGACRTPEEEKAVEEFVGSRLPKLSEAIDGLHEEATRLQMGEIGEMVNLSYIARTYFRKSRAWLSQRVNGNSVNGKRCRFTESELETFNAALRDMSARLSGVTVGY